ncbi:ATP-binding protein [uncultured Acetatifactor sp.]|uniref:AlbA family DNA-binding domain-containing protein n=1 Tax=uncultured Acetatifactor sp. TaxID=1671927 RepID=UPI00262C07EF|nr:ATP-binding protein [uncultured Acetatifactor sp.]
MGCDDDGHVTGLTNTRKLLEDIPNKIRNAMSIVVDVNRLVCGGKEYIEIVVPPYPVAISCKGVYYYRSGSTMQTLSGPELESFILRKRGASWDNMPHTSMVPGAEQPSLIAAALSYPQWTAS